MTRKDYIKLADALKSTNPTTMDEARHSQYRRDIDAIANALADDNPRFNYDRFMDYIFDRK